MNDEKKWFFKLTLGFASTCCVLIIVFSLFDFIFKPNTEIEVEVYTVNNGYGYLLNENGKVLIKQDFIPIISGKKAFCTSQDAKKTGDLVKQKIIDKKSPAITISELKQLNLDFNCLDLSTR